jgi:molybdate transport system substrate-binding protein
MKYSLSLGIIALALFYPYNIWAQDLTLVAPGRMRCPIDRMTPEFERKTGHTVKATIGPGGPTHQQVVRGEPFDVPILSAPYEDVLASGNVIASSETPLATVAVVVVVRKGEPKPDISTPEAVKATLLAAKSISYPDGSRGGNAGASFDETLNKLGIFEQMKPKIKRLVGVDLMHLLTDGEVSLAVTFASEVSDPNVEVVGPLPREISTPATLVGFVSTHSKSPDAAKALLRYLSSSDAAVAYTACGMQAGR